MVDDADATFNAEEVDDDDAAGCCPAVVVFAAFPSSTVSAIVEN
jgi:hypothetical protein